MWRHPIPTAIAALMLLVLLAVPPTAASPSPASLYGMFVVPTATGTFEPLPPLAYLPLITSQPTGWRQPGTLLADNNILEPGHCTTLHWATQNADQVYLNDWGVAAIGSVEVCPAQTTTYTLRVVLFPAGCPTYCSIDFITKVIINVVPPPVAGAEKAVALATAYMRQAAGNLAVDRAHVEVLPKSNGWAVIFRDADASCAEASLWPGACIGPFPTPTPPLMYRDVYACVNDVSWLVVGAGGSIAGPLDAAHVCRNPTYPPATPQAIQEMP
jgi:hypothetical protein